MLWYPKVAWLHSLFMVYHLVIVWVDEMYPPFTQCEVYPPYMVGGRSLPPFTHGSWRYIGGCIVVSYCQCVHCVIDSVEVEVHVHRSIRSNDLSLDY